MIEFSGDAEDEEDEAVDLFAAANDAEGEEKEGEEQDEEGEDEDEVEEYTLEIESMLRKDFRPGKGTVKPLKLTIDPVDMLHRSLLWYFVSTLFTR